MESVAKAESEFEAAIGGERIASRRIVLAYGLRDEIPAIPGVEALLGRGVFHCPTCDGPEVSGGHAIVLGPGERAAGLSLELLQWAERITLITQGEPFDVSREVKKTIGEHPIVVTIERVMRMESADSKGIRVSLESNATLKAQGLFFTLGTSRNATLAEDLGCKLDPATDTIAVDEHLATSVPGVYAIGDLIAGPQLVIRAAADGARAALAVHKSLLPSNRVLG